MKCDESMLYITWPIIISEFEIICGGTTCGLKIDIAWQGLSEVKDVTLSYQCQNYIGK